ncbi:hypothetical protein [Sporocytophaga myxococcoides]|uniref:hypothetical protein n=1 Tax=Sporocytophaga myxococcoides TaxID=153721 RepID=UPI000413C0FE|nr:hypothetical protein [Sporocytophaga myxococcoides]
MIGSALLCPAFVYERNAFEDNGWTGDNALSLIGQAWAVSMVALIAEVPAAALTVTVLAAAEINMSESGKLLLHH